MQITTIGLDIAKNVFQVHGSDANEKVVVRKRLLLSFSLGIDDASLAPLQLQVGPGCGGTNSAPAGTNSLV